MALFLRPTYSFSNDTTMGMYRYSPGTLAFSSNTYKLFLNTDFFYASNGSFLPSIRVSGGNAASTPTYTFNNDNDTGMYRLLVIN